MSITLPSGMTIAYEITGDGEIIVLIPGGIGDRLGMENIQKNLSDDFRVINYDRRNSGASGYAKIESPYDASIQAQDLIDLSRSLHLSRFNIVAHSYGAIIGLIAARALGASLHTLTLVEPPILTLVAQPEPIIFQDIKTHYSKFIRDIECGNIEDGVGAFVNYTLGEGNWERLSRERKNVLCAAHMNYVAMISQSMEYSPRIEYLHTIAAPTLLISGEKSQPYFHLINKYLAEHLSQGKINIIPEVGHGIFRYATPIASKTIKAFIHGS